MPEIELQVRAPPDKHDVEDERKGQRDHGGDGRALDPKAQRIDENGVEDGVQDQGGRLDDHRRPGISLGRKNAVYGVSREHEDDPQPDDCHVAHRQIKNVSLRPQEKEKPLLAGQPRRQKGDAENRRQDQTVDRGILRAGLVLGPEPAGDDRVDAHADPRVEADDDEEEREGEGQGGDGFRAQPADEGGIDEVVHRLDEHGDGDGTGHGEKRPPGIGDEFLDPVSHVDFDLRL